MFVLACLGAMASAQSTPERPKAPDYKEPVKADTLSNAGSTLQSFDAIRDKNLGVAQKSGCPPEIAARIADLKWKLELGQSRAGTEAGVKPNGQAGHAKSIPFTYASVANDWFKNDSDGAAPSPAQIDTLDSVLPGGGSDAANKRASSERPRSAESLQAEIHKLEAGCVAR
jgi:hypothetical protein